MSKRVRSKVKARGFSEMFLLRAPQIALALFLVFLFYSTVQSLPPRAITIEAGVKGGLYDQYAQRLKADLTQYGIKTTVLNRKDSNLIASDINDPNNPTIGGFVAQKLEPDNFPNLNQIGTVENAPIYFVTAANSKIDSLYKLTNQSLALYPAGSSAYDLCRKVLDIYGVNSNITPKPVGNENAIIQSVLNNQNDLGCFLTNSYDSTILKYITLGKLKVISLENTLGASIHSVYFQQNTLQPGSLSVNPPIPQNSINLLSVPIEFMVKSNLNHSLITAITLSLKSEFSAPSPFYSAKTFPTSEFIDFPIDSRSQSVLKNGKPWVYDQFSFPIAAFLDQWLNTYGALLGTLVVMLTVLDHIGFRKFLVKIQNSRVRSANRYLDRVLLKSKTVGLTDAEKRHLARMEKWVSKQALDAQYLKRKIDNFPLDDSSSTQ